MDDQKNIHEAALKRIDYLNLIVMMAATSSDQLPYLVDQSDIYKKFFSQQISSLACLLQTHLQDLANTLIGVETEYGCLNDFRALIADTEQRLNNCQDAMPVLHQHLRNMFAFDHSVSSDTWNENGTYTHHQVPPHMLAIEWLLDTLCRIEAGQSLPDMLGEAHNSDASTRLCFASTMNMLQTWQCDLNLIIPGTISVM